MKKQTAILIAGLLAVSSAHAASYIWDGHSTDSFWTTAACWKFNTAPVPAVDCDLFFDKTARLDNTNNFAPASDFRNITFYRKAGAFILNGNAITLNGSITNLDNTPQTINLDIILAAGIHDLHAVDGNSGSTTLGGTISGSGGLTKNGSNNLILSGTNTYSGATVISGGTLTASNALALQNSTLHYNTGGGALVFGSGSTAYTLGGLEGDKDLALTNMTGMAVSLTVGNNSRDTTYSGVLSGSGSLIKTGDGLLTLTGDSTYTNTTFVSSGSLIVNGSLQSRMIEVSSGATLSGTGTVQSVTLDAGAILSAAGDGSGSLLFDADMLLAEGSTNIMQILGDSLYDVVRGSGANTLNVLGDFVFDFTGNTTVTNGSTFAVLQNWNSIAISGTTFTTIGLDAALSVDTGELVSTGSIMVIPEPTAVGLIGLGGFITLLTCRLYRRRFSYGY